MFCLHVLLPLLLGGCRRSHLLLLLLCRLLLLALLAWQTLTSLHGTSCRSCRRLLSQMQLQKELAARSKQRVV